MREFGEETPAVGFRFEFPERLPSNPWGGVLVGEFLFVRTSGMSVQPGELAAMFSSGELDPETHKVTGYVVDLEVDPVSIRKVEGDPSDHTDRPRAFAARSRIYVGSVLLLAGLLLAMFLRIASIDNNAYYLIPTALAVGGGLTALLAGRDFLESS